ncbi:hypothetical protein [Halorientalis pallida]|nr:hypothetical protein [Halorientalis pallida]
MADADTQPPEAGTVGESEAVDGWWSGNWLLIGALTLLTLV